MLKNQEYQAKEKQFDKHTTNNNDGIHNEGTDRKHFYIKVLIVFLSQVFILNLVFYTFYYIPVLNQWIGQHIWSMYLLCLLNGYNAVILLKIPNIERFFPLNVIILSVFTIFHSSIVVNITYQNGAVDDAISFIIVLITSMILFVITTKYSYDITVFFYQYFFVFVVPLLFTPIFILIFTFVGFEILTSKLFMVFTFIHFQFFTIMTVQTLQGGHDVEVEVEDYVLGSMQMFIVILCSSLSLSTLFERDSIKEYDFLKTIFLVFNIALVYFSIMINETNLKSKLRSNMNRITH
uniref:Transmembrane protein n=3 Tax=Schistosoma mansoni TaxID=6183 RepID=A0A5K4F184_SCHMA